MDNILHLQEDEEESFVQQKLLMMNSGVTHNGRFTNELKQYFLKIKQKVQRKLYRIKQT